MDVFMEKIVAKKKDFKDTLINIAVILAAIVLIFVIQLIPVIRDMFLFFAIAIIYGAYYLIKSRSIEFEYIVTNGDLDIDKIIARRKRKRIFSASCKDFDIVAKLHSDKYSTNEQNIKNRIEAVSSLDSEDVYFSTLNYKGERTIVFYEPTEKMLESFKTFIPRKVFK